MTTHGVLVYVKRIRDDGFECVRRWCSTARLKYGEVEREKKVWGTSGVRLRRFGIDSG
jgi:hypothetical protein